MRPIRKLRIYRADIQHGSEISVRTENRRSATAQASVSRTEVLRAVDRYRALFRDAGAYSVRTLYVLGPDPALPDTPVRKLI